MPDVLQSVNKFYNLEDALVLGVASMVVIFVMRLFECRRRTIAVSIIIFGFCFSCFIQPDPPAGWGRARFSWISRNGLFGSIVSVGSFYFYKSLMKKAEDRLGMKGDDDLGSPRPPEIPEPPKTNDRSNKNTGLPE